MDGYVNYNTSILTALSVLLGKNYLSAEDEKRYPQKISQYEKLLLGIIRNMFLAISLKTHLC